MSFYTKLNLYRPSKPPVITGESLANFIDAFQGLRVSEGKARLGVEVKFGMAIDQEEKPIQDYERRHDLVWSPKEPQWDLESHCPSLKAIYRLLARYNENIYRAFIELGCAKPDICGLLTRNGCPDNEVELHLDGWSLEIGPVFSSILGSEDHFFVGWVSLSISGSGYLFPWTFAELVQRAESDEGIRKVRELCKKTWPVDPMPPNLRQKKMRRKMGDLWPYSKIDLPWNWYWGIDETG